MRGSRKVLAILALVLALAAFTGPARAGWWNEGLKHVASLATFPGEAVDLRMTDTRAYLACIHQDRTNPWATTKFKIHAVGIKTPSAPVILGTWTASNIVRDFDISGPRLYAVEYSLSPFQNRLLVVDMKTPASPKVLGHKALPDVPNRIKVVGSRAYILYRNFVKIYDASSPAGIAELGSQGFLDNIVDMAIAGYRILLLDNKNALHICNVANPRRIVLERQLSIAPGDWFTLRVSGSKAYFVGPSGVQVCDWTRPADEASLTTLDIAMESSTYYYPEFALLGSRLALPLGRQGVQLLDLSNLYSNNVTRGYYLTPGDANAVASRNGHLFVATGRRGLTILQPTH